MKKSLRIFASILSIWTSAQVVLEASEWAFKGGSNMTSNVATYDVCNTNLIYEGEGGYNYSLPKDTLVSYLSGKAFDNPQAYSQLESSYLREDINDLFQKIISRNPVREKVAVITAGAPGAGKTIKLRQDLEANGGQFAYICPDDVCLKNQTRTYGVDIEHVDGSKEAYQAAYNKWRPGSNAATHLILGNLIRENYAFYFGSTSTSPFTYKFFDFLKKQGYKIRLLHITAPDKVRWESIKERDKTFVQTTEQDVQEKGLLLPQRIMDTFLAYADEIEFYYRDGLKEDAKLAAKWVRISDSEVCGTLQVLSSSLYEQIKSAHDAALKVLQRADLKWEQTVEKNSKIHM